MSAWATRAAEQWVRIPARFLPFADAATSDLPLGRLFRLGLFQISVAMAVVLLNGTLNRVMIVELGVPSAVVAAMVSIPLLFAPFRALIGHRSDNYRSALGWRRSPFIWIGSMLQFGGLAIMPFALILLSGDSQAAPWVGIVGAAFAFLLVGAGLHTTQTAGLALATDLAPEDKRPRVVAFLYVMLLVGTVASSFAFAALLKNFSQVRLIQVIQGAAALTMVLNVVALWKQEARQPNRTSGDAQNDFLTTWRAFTALPNAQRALVTIALGTAAFAMQDILLEPYGGEVLHLSVGQTTALTGWLGAGMLTGFLIAAQQLSKGTNTYRLAACGVLAGLLAFPCVIFSAPAGSPGLFKIGACLIGLGSGLFSVATLTAAMAIAGKSNNGVALGAWGAVQATAAGLAIALSGAIKDVIARFGADGALGPVFTSQSSAYNSVYHIEILLLFATLVALGPLAGKRRPDVETANFGLAEFPG